VNFARTASLAAGIALASLASRGDARTVTGDHLFVVTSNGTSGNCVAIELTPPWIAAIDLEPVGASPRARHFLGLHWIVNGSPDDDIQVIDPATFDTILRFPVGAGTDPRDIAVVDATRAYVSRFDSRWLLLVNPTTGAPVDSVDLGGFADADGLPECAWMELDGSRLFVQVQRVDRLVSGTTVPPALLAVVDVETNALVDVDTGRPGVQGIELAGPIPSYKMQRNAATRRLTVSTPGILLDGTGGIEEIDLDALANVGFLLSEEEFALDLGPHLIVSPARGYVVGHTDFALSSHLDAFSIPEGGFLGEWHMTFAWVEAIAWDELEGVVFFPDPNAGVIIFDAATGAQAAGPIVTGLPPVDVVVVRSGPPVAAGDPPAGGMRLVVAPNPAAGLSHVRFHAPRSGAIDAAFYDVRGRLVRRIDARTIAEGPAAIVWDGLDAQGRPVGRGVYLLRVRGDGFRSATKLHRLR
jgi:hypothetical protein